MKLDSIDARVLDLMADDYYGLREITHYFAQLLPTMNRKASDELSRSRVKEYVQAGFAAVFVGNFATGKNIQRAADELAILDDPASWETTIADGVAVTATPKAEAPVVAAWPPSN